MFPPVPVPGGLVEDLLLGGLEHAVEAPQHGEGEDDAPVLGLLVVAPQQVGDRPDERRVVADDFAARRHVAPMLVVAATMLASWKVGGFPAAP